jgi:hypothetical protein
MLVGLAHQMVARIQTRRRLHAAPGLAQNDDNFVVGPCSRYLRSVAMAGVRPFSTAAWPQAHRYDSLN